MDFGKREREGWLTLSNWLGDIFYRLRTIVFFLLISIHSRGVPYSFPIKILGQYGCLVKLVHGCKFGPILMIIKDYSRLFFVFGIFLNQCVARQ